MALHRRTPRSLSAILAPLPGRLAPATLLAEVQAAWREVVGAEIAQECRPVAEGGGVLTVACSAAVWSEELALMSSSILPALNTSLTTGVISGLRVVADGR
jgi:predicted nucleic acid-binding Zn ribbon protein